MMLVSVRKLCVDQHNMFGRSRSCPTKEKLKSSSREARTETNRCLPPLLRVEAQPPGCFPHLVREVSLWDSVNSKFCTQKGKCPTRPELPHCTRPMCTFEWQSNQSGRNPLQTCLKVGHAHANLLYTHTHTHLDSTPRTKDRTNQGTVF